MFEEDIHRIPTMAYSEDEQIESVRPVIAHVVANTPPITARQLLNIVFYADSVASEEFLDKRLTRVEWELHETHVTADVIGDSSGGLLFFMAGSEFETVEVDAGDDESTGGPDRTVYYCDISDEYTVNDFPDSDSLTSSYLEASWSPFADTEYFTEFMKEVMSDLGFENTGSHDNSDGDSREKCEITNEVIADDRADDSAFREWLRRHPDYPYASKYDKTTTLNE